MVEIRNNHGEVVLRERGQVYTIHFSANDLEETTGSGAIGEGTAIV